MLAWGVTALLTTLGLADWLVTLVGFAGSTLPFLYIFLRDRKDNLWALIPGGIIAVVGAATVFGMLVGGDWVAAFVQWGIALAFVVVYANNRRNWWALIPAGVMALVGFSVSPLVSSADILLGVGLILVGLFVIVRMLLRQP